MYFRSILCSLFLFFFLNPGKRFFFHGIGNVTSNRHLKVELLPGQVIVHVTASPAAPGDSGAAVPSALSVQI